MAYSSILRGLVRLCIQLVLVSMMGWSAAHASIQEVDDEILSKVTGFDGVRIDLHLEFNANAVTEVNLDSSISIGFFDATNVQNTFLVYHAFGGVMDIAGLSIDAKAGPVGIGDYVEIGLPVMVLFKQFGFRALSAQNTIEARPTTSYGQWLFNGGATTTGSVYIWPAK